MYFTNLERLSLADNHFEEFPVLYGLESLHILELYTVTRSEKRRDTWD